ncbi:MoxR family ATPase [Frankia sp. CiP3]|uniref:MoxR family ATPase n=1 Tax=Frankia sp. CiP3 TaxID=2880971 RepID=UPI001EF4D897|nr:MoxR family ATPase [Frankia sp. CiP3]
MSGEEREPRQVGGAEPEESRQVGGGGPGAPGWWLFRGSGAPADVDRPWPAAPAWRRFGAPADVPPPPSEDDDPLAAHRRTVAAALLGPDQIRAVNVALALRRPILVTDPDGVVGGGLAHLIARELRLGRVLRWFPNSRSTVRDGVYEYDAIGAALRLRGVAAEAAGLAGVRRSLREQVAERRAASQQPAPSFVRLGPLGTALLPRPRPRVLLIDRLDRSGYELPDDLLEVIEGGRAVVPELAGLPTSDGPVAVAVDDPGRFTALTGGVIQCAEFPVIVITSNGDRAFSSAFRRRCVHVQPPESSDEDLRKLLRHLFGSAPWAADLVDRFEKTRDPDGRPTVDRLLEAAHLATQGLLDEDGARTLDAVWGAAGPAPGGFVAGLS